MMKRIGSLFSGSGSLDIAVERVFGGTVVWQAELDQDALQVLSAHWPNVPKFGNVARVDWGSAPPVDILCGGWPCQPFSAAGKRFGTEDERALWPHFAAAIRILRPEVVVMENVPRILAAGEWGRAADDLAALRYDFAWCCLRASDIGAPHERERMFAVAFRRDEVSSDSPGG